MARTRLKAIAVLSALVLACSLVVPSLAFADLATTTLETNPAGAMTAADVQASVTYSVHVRKGKWQSWTKDGVAAGKKSPIDGLKISTKSNVSGSVQYQVYITGMGWQKVRGNGQLAGKLGKKYGVEAVRAVLVGDLSKYYNVTYRVKAKKGGWSAWKQNGGVAGKGASNNPLTSVKVKLVKKSKETASGNGLVNVRYRVRMQDKKWKPWQQNNATAGKNSSSSKVYSFAIALDKGTYSGSISYRVHYAGGKWSGWKKNGAATKSSSKVEAVQIKLSGSLAQKYDVVYRVNIKGVGWQKRVRNGETAGSIGWSRRIRSIRIQLVDKNKRTGWIGSGTSWQYYKNGSPLKSQWVITKESPIDELQGSADKALHYWVDSSGFLAVSRFVNPKSERDAGAGFNAYASQWGYLYVNKIARIDGSWYIADSDGIMSKTSRSNLIKRYVNWAVKIANDNSHGYSQYNRWGPDYDCSSLVVASLFNTGFDTGGATYTGNMKSELTQHGFYWSTDFSNLQRGDILLVHRIGGRQHTEIYLGGGKTVGAHIAETGTIHGKRGDQTGHEIDVGPYYSIWDGYLRLVG